MKSLKLALLSVVSSILVFRTGATTFYVNVSNTAPASPFASWSDAATNIQDAIDASTNGDLVLVTNGVYQTGGRLYRSRIAVTNAVTVQSVNGPLVTIIQGYQTPGTINDVNAMRCAYLVDGAALSGFTLTNGATYYDSGGGVQCLSSNSVISNCVITGNSSGGVINGTYNNCVISYNTTGGNGGGGCYGTYNNCLISYNTAGGSGGGVFFATAMNNCAIVNNNCTSIGGGVWGGTYYDFTTITILNNCTIAGNYASPAGTASSGGGVYGGILTNCIVYYNKVSGGGGSMARGTNTWNSAGVYNCCTTQTNTLTGANNISNTPCFMNLDAGDFHLAPWSPCIDAGNTAAVTGNTDLDGNPRIVNGVVDIGAYEYQYQFAGTVHYVDLNSPNPVSPYTSWTTAATNIQDGIDAASAGEYVIVNDGTYNIRGRPVYGLLTNRVVVDKAVLLRSANGLTTTFIAGNPFLGDSAVRCVYLTNNAVLMGFTLTNGATRINAGDKYEEQSGGGIWCESASATVSNCVVAKNLAALWGGGTVSGTLINCILTNNSANNSLGGGALGSTLISCTITHNSATFGGGAASNTLFNCTLNGNRAIRRGGGTYSSILTNCFLSGNSATNGGGAAFGTLTGCTLSNNIAFNGGGSYTNTLNNCTLIGNCATNNGGGAFACVLNNCSLLFNTATNGGGGTFACTLSNSTLSGNYAPGKYGGGACFGTLNNCTLSNNAATHGGGTASNTLYNCILYSNTVNADGGGAFVAALNSCILESNTASSQGGGSYGGTLNGCILIGNQAWMYGGGAESGNLNNCLVIHNSTTGPGYGAIGADNCKATNCTIIVSFGSGGGGPVSGTFVNSIIEGYWGNGGGGIMLNCCIPGLAPGSGWITNDPAFVNLSGDDYHLQSSSPCINAGRNSAVTGATDLDGNPRIVGGTVDIGAYEFQNPTSVISYAWLQQYGLPTDGSADYLDSDGDGMNNWQEWIAGTIPTNPTSVLAVQSPGVTTTNATITWQSVAGINYFVQRGSDLGAQPPFSTIQSNIVGLAGTTSYIDTNAIGSGPFFYRVGVQQ